MSNRSIRLAIVVLLLVVHTAVTVLTLMDVGFLGIFEAAFANWGARQVFSDLSVALVLYSFTMVADARKHGLTVWPFLLAILPLGSFSPLAYVLWRETKVNDSQARGNA